MYGHSWPDLEHEAYQVGAINSVRFHEKVTFVKIKNSFLLIVLLGYTEQRNPASIRSQLKEHCLGSAARLVPYLHCKLVGAAISCHAFIDAANGSQSPRKIRSLLLMGKSVRVVVSSGGLIFSSGFARWFVGLTGLPEHEHQDG